MYYRWSMRSSLHRMVNIVTNWCTKALLAYLLLWHFKPKLVHGLAQLSLLHRAVSWQSCMYPHCFYVHHDSIHPSQLWLLSWSSVCWLSIYYTLYCIFLSTFYVSVPQQSSFIHGVYYFLIFVKIPEFFIFSSPYLILFNWTIYLSQYAVFKTLSLFSILLVSVQSSAPCNATGCFIVLYILTLVVLERSCNFNILLSEYLHMLAACILVSISLSILFSCTMPPRYWNSDNLSHLIPSTSICFSEHKFLLSIWIYFVSCALTSRPTAFASLINNLATSVIFSLLFPVKTTSSAYAWMLIFLPTPQCLRSSQLQTICLSPELC